MLLTLMYLDPNELCSGHYAVDFGLRGAVPLNFYTFFKLGKSLPPGRS